MAVFPAVLIGLATGVIFGFALEKSRVYEPGVIVGQMQLKNFLMLKVFLAAVITGLVLLAVLNGVFGISLKVKPVLWQADIIGGLILGAGIALAGACPGTTLAQIGAGYRDAWFILLGGIVGALTYGYVDVPITAHFAEQGEKVTFADLAGIPFWAFGLAAAIVLTGLVGLLEWAQPWTKEVGPDHDGLMPGPQGNGQPIRAKQVP